MAIFPHFELEGLVPLGLCTMVPIICAAFCRLRIESEAGNLHWERATATSVLSSRFGSEWDLVLALQRLAVGVFILWSIKWKVNSPYRAMIPRKGMKPFGLGGWQACATFTVWNWILMGLYHAVLGVLGVARCTAGNDAVEKAVHVYVWRALWVVFELAFSCCVLVFSSVWLVLIPAAHMQPADMRPAVVSAFYNWFSLAAHNLNLVFMALDLVSNNMEFLHAHFSFILIWGSIYIPFNWAFHAQYGVWFYFFLDHTKQLASWWILSLLIVLYKSFEMGGAICHYLKG